MKTYFVTLTYKNEEYAKLIKECIKEGYDKDNELASISIRRFLERWRKEHKKSIKHWFITEIGGGRYEHLHIHGLVWTDKDKKDIEKHWRYGMVWIGDYVNEKTINYITKYLHKIDNKHKTYKPIILSSKGIGKDYIYTFNASKNKFNGKETKEEYIHRNGLKSSLPIYYRNKLYTDDERRVCFKNTV